MSDLSSPAAPDPVHDSASGPRRSRLNWLKPRSIRIRLSAVFVLFLLLVISLGAFSIQRLGDVNRVSDEIRNRWLEDTRLLGDLNNYMSDYRTAEGTHLLSATPTDMVASDREIVALDARVSLSQRGYKAIWHDTPERALYDEFARQWAAYKAIAANVLTLSRTGAKSEAVAKYMTTSRQAFDASSDTLGRLTDRTVQSAKEASARALGAYGQARTLIITAMIVAALLLMGALVYVTRSISNPLLDLAQRMHALAANDTAVAIPGAKREDEVGEMARSVLVFRQNAIALMQSTRRLAEQAATFEEALEKERRLTAQQRNFVSMTSHEFRTPLTIIDGQAQRLIKIKDRLEPADVAERAGQIRRAVLQMTSVMNNLLGASQLIDGPELFQPAEFEPGLLLHEVCRMHREMTRGTTIEEDLSSLPATVEGDPKLLFHAFSNLVSNAIKYSSAGSPIDVVGTCDAESWIVVVRDHGIGIPDRDRKRLFERYFRGCNATGIAGTGVGLHLVEMVVALHAGQIAVQSQEGEGSTFTIRLLRRLAPESRMETDRSVA